ncbi:MAG: hypothetical protein MK365_17420, partial [Vicinamibacterales bacterium]|nr:hypothetical protein [Vicinamibacterales bacterium]
MEDVSSNDETLIEILDATASTNAESVAESFVEGDVAEKIETFIDAHEDDLRDGEETKIREILRMLVSVSETF